MIRLERVNKRWRHRGIETVIARRLTAEFPTGHCIAIMGRNGTGKSTLLKMIAGSLDPDSGTIERDCSVSWPIGFGGLFHSQMSGIENVRFIARVYGVETTELVEFVEEFAQLGKHYFMPVSSYSSGMRSRLSFGVSMGVPFDTYLLDEVSSVGDSAFKEKASALLEDRLKIASAVIVTHSKKLVRRLCDGVAILEKGQITMYNDVREGLDVYASLTDPGS
ncbi:MAG: ABC transporter ATP-binding protein [Pseudomonadota bacterium]